jgi:hypothetical protein
VSLCPQVAEAKDFIQRRFEKMLKPKDIPFTASRARRAGRCARYACCACGAPKPPWAKHHCHWEADGGQPKAKTALHLQCGMWNVLSRLTR